MGLAVTDFHEIKRLHARYCHAVDFGDVEGVVACFAPDGSFEAPDSGGFHKGEEALRQFAVAVAASTNGHIRHATLSSLIDGDEESARSLSYALITRHFKPPAGKWQVTPAAVVASCLYVDDLVKVDDRWVYARRAFCVDGWPSTLNRLRKPLDIAPVDAGLNGSAHSEAMSPLDYEAIRQLLARFAFTLDFQDFDGFADCFTPDSSFASLTRPEMGGEHRARGREELRQFAVRVGHAVRGHARHGAISILIDGDGGRARVASYGFIPMDYGTPRQAGQIHNATVGTSGIYRDEVVKVAGRWLFAERTFRYDGWPDVVDMVSKPLELALFGG